MVMTTYTCSGLFNKIASSVASLPAGIAFILAAL